MFIDCYICLGRFFIFRLFLFLVGLEKVLNVYKYNFCYLVLYIIFSFIVMFSLLCFLVERSMKYFFFFVNMLLIFFYFEEYGGRRGGVNGRNREKYKDR